ncbi:thymidylate synthase [Actinomadura rupiterrae]|uniref:thymidylate synthase n=1 Tax=Actinomadura rupiterrae TaxID=559627 RepID=UPI0020A5C4CC|nr:thymidylate synthase [Actinomadura rupiterrae]MCP2342967.1 thymidylate synthase [Actinomadura rupiterrae]
MIETAAHGGPSLHPPGFDRFTDAYTAVLAHVYEEFQHTGAPRGNACRECLNIGFTLADPRDRIVYSAARRCNIVFCFAEALWYMWGRDDLEMIVYYAPRMALYSRQGRTLTGTAYGPKLFGKGQSGTSQWGRVRELLRDQPDTKRAVLGIFAPDELADSENPDVSCTLGLHFLLRDGRLHLSTSMRANDAFTGLLSDVFAFTLIQEFAARQLGVELGSYTHHAGSMHINDVDADRARLVVEHAEADREQPRPERFPPLVMPPTGEREMSVLRQVEERLRRNQGSITPQSVTELGLPLYWQQVVLLFEVFRQIRHRPQQPINAETLDALEPGYRWLISHRWSARIPHGYPSPAPPAAPKVLPTGASSAGPTQASSQ